MLEIHTSYSRQIMVIELNGSLDSKTGFDFHEFLTEKILEGKLYFALDCSNLEFLSSGGISSLVGIHKILKKRGGLLTLFKARKEIVQLIEFLNLQELIEIHDNQDLALSWIESKKILHSSFSAPSSYANQKKEIIDKDTSKFFSSTDDRSSTNTNHTQSKENSIDDAGREEKQEEKKTSDLNAKLPPEKILFCPSCGRKLRVRQKGMYKCPACENKFHYPL